MSAITRHDVHQTNTAMTRLLTLRQDYATLTDDQWDAIKDLFDCRRKRKHTIRGIIDAILYVAIEDIHWRMLPKHFAPWQTVYYYYDKWKKSGVWARVLEALPEDIRRKARFSSFVAIYPSVGVRAIETTRAPERARIHHRDEVRPAHAVPVHPYTWILREMFDTEETPTPNPAA